MNTGISRSAASSSSRTWNQIGERRLDEVRPHGLCQIRVGALLTAWDASGTYRTYEATATALFLASALCVIGTPGNPAGAQPRSAEYSRQSDVIYGRKFGLALTMEVFTPAKPSGLGVVWVVSSSGKSSREQTLQPSFERRISPLLTHGYTIFAVIHGSSPAFQVPDFVDDATRSVRFVRHRASEFGIDGQRLGVAGSSAGGLIALMIAMRGDGGHAASEDAVERMSSRVQIEREVRFDAQLNRP